MAEPLNSRHKRWGYSAEDGLTGSQEGWGGAKEEKLPSKAKPSPPVAPRIPESPFAMHAVPEEDLYAVSFVQLTQFELVWRRFRRHPLALAGLVVLVLLVLMAIVAPWITTTTPTQMLFLFGDYPPSLAHFPNLILGTNNEGQSIWSGIAYGARYSLTIGFVSAFGASLIGVILGSVTGYYGGWADLLLMRLTDMVLAIPILPLLIILSAFFAVGASPTHIIAIFTLTLWPQPARLIRSYYLSLREQEFVMAAKAAGISDLRIIFRHMLPNALSIIIVITTLNIAICLVLEATLDFLGLGIAFPPTTSWGSIMNVLPTTITGGGNAQDELLTGNWWWGTFPGLFLMITVLAVNFIGDGLRDALDVRGKQ